MEEAEEVGRFGACVLLVCCRWEKAGGQASAVDWSSSSSGAGDVALKGKREAILFLSPPPTSHHYQTIRQTDRQTKWPFNEHHHHQRLKEELEAEANRHTHTLTQTDGHTDRPTYKARSQLAKFESMRFRVGSVLTFVSVGPRLGAQF